MKTFPKFTKFAAVIAIAMTAFVVSAFWCTSSLVENAQAECLLEDYDYGLVYSCEGSAGHCVFVRPDSTQVICVGTEGTVAYPLPPIIVVPTN